MSAFDPKRTSLKSEYPFLRRFKPVPCSLLIPGGMTRSRGARGKSVGRPCGKRTPDLGYREVGASTDTSLAAD